MGSENKERALLNHFGSARAVESASLDDLKSVEGIEDNIAKKIYGLFPRVKYEIKNTQHFDDWTNNHCANFCNHILSSWISLEI